MVFLVLILAFLLADLVVTFHVIALKRADRMLSCMGLQSCLLRRMASTSYILALHWLEILMFGVLYIVLVKYFDIGEIVGAETASDYFYFSATSYTTLGFGDLYPTSYMRIFCGIEALVGLIMIGWTIAFTFDYVTMGRNSNEIKEEIEEIKADLDTIDH